jgi:protein TonB
VARRKKKNNVILMVSVGAHVLAFVVLALIPQRKLREVVAIALREAPPKEEKKVEPPKPPDHPPPAAKAPVHVAHSTATPEPSSAAAAAANAAAFQNLGLTLDSSSADGLAVPVAPRAAAIAPPPAPPKPKVLVPRTTEAACSEELVKARPLDLVRPSYTDEARRARVQGRVRIELAVNDHGEVTDARVLDGLGYGLDEVALEAARRLRFSPAQRCKRPVAAPFVIAMRFVLNT